MEQEQPNKCPHSNPKSTTWRQRFRLPCHKYRAKSRNWNEIENYEQGETSFDYMYCFDDTVYLKRAPLSTSAKQFEV
jgi:hypothetical protein